MDCYCNYQYQAGGSLPSNAPTYVIRQADYELYDALLARQYCYILNARQMGKSSLRIHTMRKLEAQGISCAEIELSGIGSQQITAKQWYGGIIQELISGFEIRINRRQWFQEYDDLSPVQKLSKFIDTVLLKQIKQPLVIFIDEIDSVLSLDFPTDDFFALLRNCYEKRANNPEYNRLSFVLLGVATPSDLIQDPKSTPFNIGQAIDLKGLEFEESYGLAEGLKLIAEAPQAVLKEILFWSGGQPFLTQKLCLMLTKSDIFIKKGQEKKIIKALIKENIFKHWESQDEPEHLRTIRDRLLHNSRSRKSLLKLYQQILKRGKIVATEGITQMELRLSGLVIKTEGYLVIKNPIYQTVFNKQWVRQQLKVLEEVTPYPTLTTVLEISFLITLSVMGIRFIGLLQSVELRAYDHLLRQIPREKPDQRLLIVGADEEDLRLYGHPIPDVILAEVLEKIQLQKPKAIGLDIVRDQPVPPGYLQLKHQFQNNSNLIASCAFGGEDNSQSIKPPAAIPPERVGFVDLYSDHSQYNNQDYTVRRYLLSRTPNPDNPTSVCDTPYSLAWYLAYLYFQSQDISVTSQGENWQFAEVLIPPLPSRIGGYQGLDNRGNQLLIRYRHLPNPDHIAPQITFRDILHQTENFRANIFKDRIVLIGVVASSVPDPHDTPIGRMRGLSVHAHVVSQLLTRVEDKQQTLIHGLSWWGDSIFVFSVSLLSGVTMWFVKIPLYQGLSLIVCVIVIYGISWLGLIQGLWLPLFPSLLVGVITASSFFVYQFWLRVKLNK